MALNQDNYKVKMSEFHKKKKIKYLCFEIDLNHNKESSFKNF